MLVGRKDFGWASLRFHAVMACDTRRIARTARLAESWNLLRVLRYVRWCNSILLDVPVSAATARIALQASANTVQVAESEAAIVGVGDNLHRIARLLIVSIISLQSGSCRTFNLQ